MIPGTVFKDGSLEYRPPSTKGQDKKALAKFRSNYAYVLGLIFSVARTLPIGFFNSFIICSPKKAVENSQLQYEKTRTPFDGIIKVEKMLTTSEEQERGMDSELVDTLSAHLNSRRSTIFIILITFN